MRNIFMFALATTAVVAVACSENVDMGDVTTGDGTPIFQTPAPDGGDASASFDGTVKELQCISTDCPAPWATCLSDDRPAYKCGTDLKRDNDNCGSCGNKCLEYKPLSMTSRCVDGVCELEAYNEDNPIYPTDYRNCDGLLDNGFEADVVRDANNCGACGNKCPAGTPCIDAKCGCPPGKIACFGEVCVDPLTDNNHCGGCGNFCNPEPPEDEGGCAINPPNTYFGCNQGKCGALKCSKPAADCNSDLGKKCSSDGCEVASIVDNDNCGACGNKCTGGKQCVDEGNGPECAIPCARFGMTNCPQGCFDLLNDPTSCGACNAPCRPPGKNQKRACEKGVCVYDCEPGFADCNGDPADGCETNLNIHPANCGACGNSCDLVAGQPCVEGQCLTVACEAGTTR
jgi:hypothetical protein